MDAYHLQNVHQPAEVHGEDLRRLLRRHHRAGDAAGVDHARYAALPHHFVQPVHLADLVGQHGTGRVRHRDAVEHHHLPPLLHQQGSDGVADEPAGAGDEDGALAHAGSARIRRTSTPSPVPALRIDKPIASRGSVPDPDLAAQRGGAPGVHLHEHVFRQAARGGVLGVQAAEAAPADLARRERHLRRGRTGGEWLANGL
jgi:hypothetical protein